MSKRPVAALPYTACWAELALSKPCHALSKPRGCAHMVRKGEAAVRALRRTLPGEP